MNPEPKVRVPIETLCQKVTSGGTPSRSNPEFYKDGTVLWIKTGELKDWYIEDSSEKITLEAVGKSSAKVFPKNTVLMAMYGDGRTMTSVGILRKEAATNQACCAMIVDEKKCDYLYLMYALKYHREEFLKITIAGAQRNLSGGLIKNFPVVYHPLPVQQKIAAVLSAYDGLIENNTRRLQILEEMARSLHREWFVEFRFPGHELVAMVETEQGKIPQGWNLHPFSQVATFINGYAFAPHHWGGEGLPIIKIAELKNGITEKTPRNEGIGIPEKYSVNSGDLLFSWSADLDIYIWGHGKGLLNQHLFKVAPNAGIEKYFLFYSLKAAMPSFQTRSNGATMKHIKRSALDEVFILLPANHELLKAFEDLCAPLVLQVLNLKQKNVNLRRTRDLLLPKLISGEVDVSELETATGETAV